jgi:hypothetical protein
MALLTGYFDETGDSKDHAQKFVGMAGFAVPAEKWDILERKWKFILNEFKIPHFHMKEFNPSKGVFCGWKDNEKKRKQLFGSLIKTIKEIKPLPVGCVFSSEDFRSLPKRDRDVIKDPYFLSFISCIAMPSMLLENAPRDVKLATVFGEHTIFAAKAKKFHQQIQAMYETGTRLYPPEFRDMREVVQLQAADIIAYELYKEADRQRYRPTMASRFGIIEIVELAKEVTNANTLLLPTKADLQRMIEETKRIRGVVLTGGKLPPSPIRFRRD